MLTEFEVRLVNVLGSRLPPPFTGRVIRRSAAPPGGSGVVVRIGVDALKPREPDFGSVRPEQVPGSDDQRRVLRLEVDLGIEIDPQTTGDVIEQLAVTDAIIYELQNPDIRSADAFVQPGDQGFLVDSLALSDSNLNTDPKIRLHAQGWFWPIGVAGQTGRPIEQIRLREFRLPVLLEMADLLIAGGPDIDFTLSLGTTGTLQVTQAQTTATPFERIALQLFNENGAPGAGEFSGDSNGPGNSLLVDVTDGSASATYSPPDSESVDQLVVSSYAEDEDGEQYIGVELARFELAIRA